MDNQDWQTVTVRGRNHGPKIVVERKGEAGAESQRLYKVENDEKAPKRRRLTAESRRALADARMAMKKTQRDADTLCAFPPNCMRDFESGAAVPSGPQISIMHRAFAAEKLVLRTETF